eukprot:69704_1
MSFFSKQAFAEDEDDSDSDIDCEFGNAIFSQTNHTIKPIQIIKNEVTTTTTNKPIVHHQILGNISDIQSLDLDTEDDINDLDKTVPTKHIESDPRMRTAILMKLLRRNALNPDPRMRIVTAHTIMTHKCFPGS